MHKRDKSPIIQVNLMKENLHQAKSQKASLNLVRVLATRRSDMNSLWEPDDQKQHTYLHSTRRSNTSREREFNDSTDKITNQQCSKHYNKSQQRNRNVQFICCMSKCDTQLLCRECKHKILSCKHEQQLTLSEFLEQPILVFLKRDSQDLVNNLILQQMQIYHKVKYQAEQSKKQLNEYLEMVQNQIQMRCQAIFNEFDTKVNDQLKMIRNDIDKLVQTSLVYKDDFENRLNQNQNLIESIKQFKLQSEDPYEQVMNQINQLQCNLNKIPQLNQLVNEQKLDVTIKDFSYQKLII